MDNLGERLREIRKIKGLSQRDLAEIMGVTTRAYQRYEKNAQKASYDKIARIVKKFKDINSRWLLTGEGNIFAEKSKKTESIGLTNNTKYEKGILLEPIKDPIAKEVVKLIQEGYYTPRIMTKFLNSLQNIKNASIKL